MEPRANAPVASPPWVAMRPIHRSLIIPGNLPTIPENLPDYSRIFPDSFYHYYARNYAGIIDACLYGVFG